MTCPRDQLPGLVYGDLLPAEAAAVEAHVEDCPTCRAEYTSLRQVKQALSATPFPEAVVDLDRLFQKASEHVVPRRRWPKRVLVTLAIAAAVLLALANLEIRAEAHQVVIRWGRAPLADPAEPPPVYVAQAAPAALTVLDERVDVVQELSHALAADVDRRDQRRGDDLARTEARLDTLYRYVARRFQDTDRDVDALYLLRTQTPEKGANP